MKLWF